MMRFLLGPIFACCAVSMALAAPPSNVYEKGDLAGSLKTADTPAIYNADHEHLWNRLFAAFYIRESNLPAQKGGASIRRIEGGDYIDLLVWGGTKTWDDPARAAAVNKLLDEFIDDDGADLITNPLKRAMLLRDLWAVHDFFVGQNIRRTGTRKVRDRRNEISQKLARILESLALPRKVIEQLPNTYAAAITSGAFEREQDFASSNNYLPHELLTDPDQWVEIDFFQPDLHEDLYERFITLHARAYRGRSYFRIFYRFPGGRQPLTKYLERLDKEGVDWRQAAQDGFILLKSDAPQVPVGMEVALVQYMMTLDDQLRPTPTRIVESVRHRTFRNVDGSSTPETNTGVGMHVVEYTLRRRLLFDHLKAGGLHREADDAPLYRVIFQPLNAPDWGNQKRKTLFQQCADCHMTPKASRPGVLSMPSIVHMGGFNAGAQLGIALPLDPSEGDTRGRRVARWKTQHETYRQLLETLGR